MKLNKKMVVLFVLISTLASLIPLAFAVSPIVQQVTGGGWIMCGDIKKTFGFNAEELSDGSLKGVVQFIDHGIGLNIHGYDITALAISGNTASIYGLCRVNGDNAPYRFHVYVEDWDEPGIHDWFQIELIDYPSDYFAYGELGPAVGGGGGNIQIHVPIP